MTMNETIRIAAGPHTGKTGTLVRGYRYDDGSADVEIDGTVYDIPRQHMPPEFSAYAWPGGYPIAYYAGGDLLCADCAKKVYDDDGVTLDGWIIEEAHDTEYCADCSAVIAYQNWCDFCHVSCDCDEDTPHVCKPLKWQLQYRYQNTGLPPSISRYATREAARKMARYYRNRGYQMVNVSPIVPPIMPY